MTIKETCVTDAEARVALPTGFANATLVIEQLSDVEVRIRKTDAFEDDEKQFAEEQIRVLSDRDRDHFLDLLENPPRPSPTLRRALSGIRQQHG